MAITNDMRAELSALRALVLAMNWHAMEQSGDPSAYAAKLRGFAEATKDGIPAELAAVAWPVLADALDGIEGLARHITPAPPA